MKGPGKTPGIKRVITKRHKERKKAEKRKLIMEKYRIQWAEAIKRHSDVAPKDLINGVREMAEQLLKNPYQSRMVKPGLTADKIVELCAETEFKNYAGHTSLRDYLKEAIIHKRVATDQSLKDNPLIRESWMRSSSDMSQAWTEFYKLIGRF